VFKVCSKSYKIVIPANNLSENTEFAKNPYTFCRDEEQISISHANNEIAASGFRRPRNDLAHFNIFKQPVSLELQKRVFLYSL